MYIWIQLNSISLGSRFDKCFKVLDKPVSNTHLFCVEFMGLSPPPYQNGLSDFFPKRKIFFGLCGKKKSINSGF